jgi:hypothetical protein
MNRLIPTKEVFVMPPYRWEGVLRNASSLNITTFTKRSKDFFVFFYRWETSVSNITIITYMKKSRVFYISLFLE